LSKNLDFEQSYLRRLSKSTRRGYVAYHVCIFFSFIVLFCGVVLIYCLLATIVYGEQVELL